MNKKEKVSIKNRVIDYISGWKVWLDAITVVLILGHLLSFLKIMQIEIPLYSTIVYLSFLSGWITGKELARNYGFKNRDRKGMIFLHLWCAAFFFMLVLDMVSPNYCMSEQFLYQFAGVLTLFGITEVSIGFNKRKEEEKK